MSLFCFCLTELTCTVLQLSDKYSSSLVTFKGSNWTWARPTSFKDLLILKNKYPDAPVIMGNTIAGTEKNLISL